MSDEKRSARAFALISLRSARGWSRKRLAAEMGLREGRLISSYERGEKPFTRESLDRMVLRLGYPREAADALISVHGFLAPPAPEEDVSPVALTLEELREIDRAALTRGWTAAEDLRGKLRRARRAGKAEAARQKAGELWERLKAVPPEERSSLVAGFPEFRSWALAVRVCEESVRAAAHRADEALELADLAVSIAERSPGEEGWRSRLRGYAWAHVANARRVANDFDGADEAFARAWDLWRAGSDSGLLPEWRLLDLEASLRRAERRFPEALELLDRARAVSGAGTLAAGRILMNKSHVLEQLGDFKGALAALEEAAPSIEAAQDPRLLFGLRFNTAANLRHLGRYAAAARQLAQARGLAVQQGNALDLIRVVWLEARVAAGQGKTEEAVAGLEQVQRDFTARELPYDAALSSLDLALLWLEAGRTAEVRELARGMAWIFASKKIHREALAALSLFCEAARRETATLELARSVIARVEEARRSAPRPEGRGRG